MAELFGFSITRLKKTSRSKTSFTQPQADDGTQTIAVVTLVSTLIWRVAKTVRRI